MCDAMIWACDPLTLPLSGKCCYLAAFCRPPRHRRHQPVEWTLYWTPPPPTSPRPTRPSPCKIFLSWNRDNILNNVTIQHQSNYIAAPSNYNMAMLNRWKTTNPATQTVFCKLPSLLPNFQEKTQYTGCPPKSDFQNAAEAQKSLEPKLRAAACRAKFCHGHYLKALDPAES